MISEIECKNIGFVNILNSLMTSERTLVKVENHLGCLTKFICETTSENMLIPELACKTIGFVNILNSLMTSESTLVKCRNHLGGLT